jgi:hypothetical protein
MAAPFPRKPKGMWRQTYERLRNQAFKAEMLTGGCWWLWWGY